MCHLTPELTRSYQGRRVGAKGKTGVTHAKRRTYKPSVSSIFIGNVIRLQNKVDELARPIRTQILGPESWSGLPTEKRLTSCIPDANVELQEFTSVMGTKNACRQCQGAALILCMNNRWCDPSHFPIKDTLLLF